MSFRRLLRAFDCRRWRWAALLVVCGALSAAMTSAAPLTALCPADVGLTIELRGAGARAEAFRDSELFRRWVAFPPVARWREQAVPEWKRISAEFAQQLGLPAKELIVELLGREALLAVWPGEGAVPGEPPTLLLVRGDGPTMTRLVDRVCELQERAGAVRAANRATHAGVEYRVQVIERDGRETPVCFAVFDDVGVVTGSEEILRAVLNLRAVASASGGAGGSLDALPAYRAAAERVATDSVVRAFVNPRSWDDQFVPESMPPDERWLGEAWRAADYWVASLEVGPRTALETHIEFAPDRLTPALRESLASLSGETRFFDHVPADALVAVAGRIDLPRLVRALSPSVPEGERDPAALFLAGWNWLSQSLGGLGPEAGACLLDAPRPDSPGVAPFAWIAAARVNQNALAGGQPRTPEELHIALRSALTLAAEGFNSEAEDRHVTVEAIDGDGEENLLAVHNVPALPAAMVPTFTAAGEWLWGASSPELLRAAAGGVDDSLGSSGALSELASPRLRPGHVAYANLGALRRWVERHRSILLAQAERNRGMDPQQAEQSVQQLLSLLQLADSALLAAEVSERGVSLEIAVSAGPASVP